MKVNARGLSVNREGLRVGSIQCTNNEINGVNRIMAKIKTSDNATVAVGDGGKVELEEQMLINVVGAQEEYLKITGDTKRTEANASLIDGNAEWKKKSILMARHLSASAGHYELPIIDMQFVAIPSRSGGQSNAEHYEKIVTIMDANKYEHNGQTFNVDRWEVRGNPSEWSLDELENELFHASVHATIHRSKIIDKNGKPITSVTATKQYHNSHFRGTVNGESHKDYSDPKEMVRRFATRLDIGTQGNHIVEFEDKDDQNRYGAMQVVLGDVFRKMYRERMDSSGITLDVPAFVATDNGISADGRGGDDETKEKKTSTKTTYSVRCSGCKALNKDMPNVSRNVFSLFSSDVQNEDENQKQGITKFSFGTDAKHPIHECGGRYYGIKKSETVTK